MNHLFRIVNSSLIVIVFSGLFVSCTKQNEPKALILQKPLVGSPEYYANLRTYKKSNHQIAFGWFGNSKDGITPEMQTRLENVPDSMDIIALWGQIPIIGSPQLSALQNLQKQKGIRFVWTQFGSGVISVLDSATYNRLIKEDTLKAIAAMAKSIVDTLDKYNINGFDLDYEPGERNEYSTIFGSQFKVNGNNKYVLALFQELGKYLGPKSGTDRLLIIDGYSESGVEPYINYFMQQAYGSPSPSTLESRLSSFGLGECPPQKFVPCENFEDFWKVGGVSFSDPIRGEIPSLLGFAYWNPMQGAKGGVGAYHMEYEYSSSTAPYFYMKQAIQIMNPAVK